MTPEQERWAEALAILKWQDEAAGAYVADRIVQLAIKGSDAGVERFKDIAVRIDALIEAPIQ